MKESRIKPEKITSPMQLMAAWFVMLSILVGILLAAASQITEPRWIAPYLVISATILILIVISCVFLMLTKFRPHLQDNDNYAVWLKDSLKYGKSDAPELGINNTVEQLSLEVGANLEEKIDFLKKARLCRIEVINAEGAESIVRNLNRDGYTASLHAQPQIDGSYLHTVADSTGIWIGANLDADVVIRAIQIATSTWPQLQYLHLSTDSSGPEYMHDQIFIGGSQNAVKRFKLKAWSQEDINNLSHQLPLNDFHRVIRSKYS